MPFEVETFDSKDQRDERYDELRKRVDADGALKHPGLVKFSSNRVVPGAGKILPNYAGVLEWSKKRQAWVGRVRQVFVSTWSVAWPRN